MSKITVLVFCTAISSSGVFGQSAAAQTTIADNSCRGALISLLNEWSAISFPPPSKPGQAIVTGKDGHVTSGGQFNYMTGLMRQARAECDRGDSASAMQDIAVVRDRLNRSAHPNG
jgi:hypothetical protein